MFKDGPFLYRNTDRVRFHETTEKEVLEIYGHVHEKFDYEYNIEQGEIKAKDYLKWYNSEDIQTGMKKLKAKQAVGVKEAPLL